MVTNHDCSFVLYGLHTLKLSTVIVVPTIPAIELDNDLSIYLFLYNTS